ncbi:hypothetical protein Taro_024005 [Colocasia esculenta]|uniref:Uncharacterized protein n=1 Tax=Colocasia esculenta TaxID=4460 RepID=A0A843V6A7_COLES|nr:hypothetical protein [Colocasia esculenta]
MSEVSRTMTLHTPMGQDQSDERPGSNDEATLVPWSLAVIAMATRRKRGAQARDDEQRCEDRSEQQAPAPQGPTVLPPSPPVDYGVFMQGLVTAMQTQA